MIGPRPCFRPTQSFPRVPVVFHIVALEVPAAQSIIEAVVRPVNGHRYACADGRQARAP